MRISNRSFLTYFYRACFSFIAGYTFFSGSLYSAHAETVVSHIEIPKQTVNDPYAKYKIFIPANDWFTLSDGAKIPVRVWRAPHQQMIMLALHGFNDSRDAWEDSARYFIDQGITIISPDQRGFGEAPLRGSWAGTDRMVQDIIEETNLLKKRYPNTPIYFMGESMGGSLLMCLAARPDAPPVNGYILLAPAVWGPKQIGVIGDLSLQFLNAVVPNWELSPKNAPVKVVASNNQESLIRLYFDPLSLHNAKVKALYGLVGLMGEAVKSAPSVRYPILVIYGDRDQLVPAKAMKHAWASFPKWVRKDYIPVGYHLLLRDKNRELVAQDIISWMKDPDQWLPSGGDAATAAWMSVLGDGKVPFFMPSQMDNIVK